MIEQFSCDVTLLTTADSGPRDVRTVRLGVFHTTENNDNTPPQNVARWQLDPKNNSSYNVLVGTRGTTVRSNDDNFIPWSAGPTANRFGFHISAIGWAKRSREQWLANPGQIESLARWAADLNQRYGIPLRWLDPDQVRSGSWGFTGHAEVSLAWKEVSHTDPGKGFPHDIVLGRAAEIVAGDATTSEEKSMAEKKIDLILDQLVGHPWPEWPGWPQLGNRSVPDALGAIGEKLGVPGMYDTQKHDGDA